MNFSEENFVIDHLKIDDMFALCMRMRVFSMFNGCVQSQILNCNLFLLKNYISSWNNEKKWMLKYLQTFYSFLSEHYLKLRPNWYLECMELHLINHDIYFALMNIHFAVMSMYFNESTCGNDTITQLLTSENTATIN